VIKTNTKVTNDTNKLDCALDAVGAFEIPSPYVGAWVEAEGTKPLGAEVTGRDVTGAEVTGAEVRGEEVTGAEVTGAEVTGAEVTGADVTGALVRGAEVTGAEVTGAEVVGESVAANAPQAPQLSPIQVLPVNEHDTDAPSPAEVHKSGRQSGMSRSDCWETDNAKLAPISNNSEKGPYPSAS